LDFIKLLKSLEELLFKLVSWLLFYSITMWRSVLRPLNMMRYADTELADRTVDQYEDTLSPTLFLVPTLLLSQGLSGLLPSVFDPTEAARQLGPGSNLLIARGVIFGVYPLSMAVTLLRWKQVRITRDTLRPPFFSQCYVAAPFAFIPVLEIDFSSMPQEKGTLSGIIAVAVALFWYAHAQIRWFARDLDIGAIKATVTFIAALLIATVAALSVAVMINRDAQSFASGTG
jgi:hypothetical protein